MPAGIASMLLVVSGCGGAAPGEREVEQDLSPPDGKFAEFGSPYWGAPIDTEIRGTVERVNGSDLLVAVDPAYENLLITGNRRHPVPGEDGYSFFQTFPPDFQAHFTNIVKLETYGVGSRPASTGSPSPPLVADDGMLIQAGDRVVITGLLVIDYGHTEYADTCTDSFAYDGFPDARICFAHTEIHPYNYYAIHRLQPDVLGGTHREAHTVVAPIYDRYYSATYEWNHVLGVAGDLVEEPVTHSAASFQIPAPPRATTCAGGCQLQLVIDDSSSYAGSQGARSITSSIDQVAGVAYVWMQADGTDPMAATVNRATFTTSWTECAYGYCSCDAGYVGLAAGDTFVCSRSTDVTVTRGVASLVYPHDLIVSTAGATAVVRDVRGELLVATAGCDATHACTDGCCSAGTCVAGTTNAACGDTGTACSACAGPQFCQATPNGGTCACTPIPQATACAGLGCGTADDGCGGAWTCGTCGPNAVCGKCDPGVCYSASAACP